jgi:indolepyruvate decarboxylase
MYDGALLNPQVAEFVEHAEFVLNVGAPMTDFNTGAFTSRLNPARVITIAHHHVEIDGVVTRDIEMGDILDELARRIERTVRASLRTES